MPPRTDESVSNTSPRLCPKYWHVNGIAHDFTPWLTTHPGGRYILDVTQGIDCTELFEMYHAVSLKETFIRARVKDFEVKSEPPSETLYNWNKTALYEDMKTVVKQYRLQHGIKASDCASMVVWYMAWFTIFVVTTTRWAQGRGDSWNGMLMGWAMWFFCGGVCHAGTHYALLYNPAMSNSIGWLAGWPFMSGSGWMRQHVIGHHPYTNLQRKDPDLYHYDRIFPTHPTEQIATAPCFTYLLPLAPLYTSWIPLLKETISLLRTDKISPCTDAVCVWAPWEKAATWGTTGIIVTTLCLCWSTHGIVHTALPLLTLSVVYYAFSQVSHINARSFEVHAPWSKNWAASQILAAQGDYCATSYVANKVSVGLNCQMVHHLFPGVHPCHYPALSAVLKPVLEKHGMPTRAHEQTYVQSLKLHVAYVLNNVRNIKTLVAAHKDKNK